MRNAFFPPLPHTVNLHEDCFPEPDSQRIYLLCILKCIKLKCVFSKLSSMQINIP